MPETTRIPRAAGRVLRVRGGEVLTAQYHLLQQIAHADGAHHVEPDREAVGGRGAHDAGEQRAREAVEVHVLAGEQQAGQRGVRGGGVQPRLLLREERGSESVEFAVVALVVALGWLVADQWLQATIADCISALAASIYDLQA